MYALYLTIMVVSIVHNMTHSAKILGVFPLPLMSHQKGFLNLGKELSLRGHEVTLIVTNPMKDRNLINLTEIDVSATYQVYRKKRFIEVSQDSSTKSMLEFRELFEMIDDVIFNIQEIKDLINSDKHFDLVLVESRDPLHFAFGARFNALTIAMSSFGVLMDIHNAVGNPSHPILAPEMFINLAEANNMSLIQRLHSFYYSIWYRIACKWVFYPKMDEIIKQTFGENMPPLKDIVSQISLVMTQVNPVMHTVRPNIPIVINTEQLHIDKPKPLPKDIKDLLDASIHGAVYFSLGTNVLSSKLSNTTLKYIIEALGNLPYNVLWKFETDLTDGPVNVITRKWFPQQDILGHPNVKVFVTQGGIQSIEEAITMAVPMVGIPFGIDQPTNIRKLVKWGMGLQLKPSEINAKLLAKHIVTVATDPSFKQNVMKCKRILEDQPIRGIEKAIWWIEYTLRNNGTQHLHYPGANVPLYKYLMLDVILILILILTVAISMLLKVVNFLCSNVPNKICVYDISMHFNKKVQTLQVMSMSYVFTFSRLLVKRNRDTPIFLLMR